MLSSPWPVATRGTSEAVRKGAACPMGSFRRQDVPIISVQVSDVSLEDCNAPLCLALFTEDRPPEWLQVLAQAAH
jgi:hypothetical protein